MTRAALAVSLGLALFGCRAKEKSPLERGAGVYVRACATCHGSARVPGRQLGFKVKPPNLASPDLQRRLSDQALRSTIREGKGEMPPFGRMLSDEELSQLVVYLRSLTASAN